MIYGNTEVHAAASPSAADLLERYQPTPCAVDRASPGRTIDPSHGMRVAPRYDK